MNTRYVLQLCWRRAKNQKGLKEEEYRDICSRFDLHRWEWIQEGSGWSWLDGWLWKLWRSAVAGGFACLLNDSHAMLRVEVSPVTEEQRNSTQITYSRSAGYSILFPLLSSDTLLIVNLSSKPSNHYRRARQSISRLQLYSQNNVNCSIKVRKPSFILYNTEAWFCLTYTFTYHFLLFS